MAQANDTNKYKCNQCNAQFTSQDMLLQHQKQHQGASQSKQFSEENQES